MLVLKNAKIHTVLNGTIDRGDILIENGKIARVAPSGGFEIPAGAKVMELDGMTVTPGLIDPHTHISTSDEPTFGRGDCNESGVPNASFGRAQDALNPFDLGVRYARSAGFTTCCTLPGSANVIGGTSIAFKTRPAKTVFDMMIPGSEQMKMALGENPNNSHNKTRMGVAALLREALFNARNYAEKLEKTPDTPHDFKLDALVPLITGKMKARIHCHRADDIVTAIRISEEFGLDYALEHATEAHRIPEVLAERGITVTIGPLTTTPYKKEIWRRRLDTPAILEKAGVNFCLTADTGMNTRWLTSHIGTCMTYGLSFDAALRAVTLNAARLLGQNSIGAIAEGYDAELAVFDGMPFSNLTTCLYTVFGEEVVRSERLFDLLGDEVAVGESGNYIDQVNG